MLEVFVHAIYLVMLSCVFVNLLVIFNCLSI